MANPDPLTQEILRELFYYHQDSGDFVRVKSTSSNARAGTQAGCLDHIHGYLLIHINGTLYRAGRLAWLYMTGKWPTHEIDHKNRNTLDNSWKNLREANRSQNNQNKKCRNDSGTGIKGVTWHKQREKYRVRLGLKHLGLFDTLEEARMVWLEAATDLHGEFFHGG